VSEVVDLFKFVALRSPTPPDEAEAGRLVIRDQRLGTPARVESPPVPDQDGPNYARSPVASAIYTAVVQELETMEGTASVPERNRAVAARIDAASPSPGEDLAAAGFEERLALFSDILAAPKSLSVVIAALDSGLAAMEAAPVETRERVGGRPKGNRPAVGAFKDYTTQAVDGADSRLALDFGAAFDRLYLAYLAKQLRAVDLEEAILPLRHLHAVRSIAAFDHGDSSSAKSYTGRWSIASAMRIANLEDLLEGHRALPKVHPLVTKLVGYYRPFNRIRPVGIGDLLVVKQFLLGYQAGEIAHVENILSGESKTREHRVLDRTVDSFKTESESTTDVTRELETTERFELKSESESTIQRDLSAEVSGQVSGKYGVVEVSASAGVSYSQSTSDSRKSSNNYAKDVVDRSLSRIQQRTREERSGERTHEVEEINKHVLRADAGNVTGIYRWLDKKYKAQVYNYGKRLMFEFIVPEPAAFVLADFDRRRSAQIRPAIPAPPSRPVLTISTISQATVDQYAKIFDLGSIPPPPPPIDSVQSASMGAGGLGGHLAGYTEKTFNVPEGCEVYAAEVSGDYTGVDLASQGKDFAVDVSIGGQTLRDSTPWSNTTARNSWERRSFAFSPPLVDQVGVAVHTYRLEAFSLSVALRFRRTEQALKAWQSEVYARIMDAYEAATREHASRLAEYDDEFDAFQISQGVVVRGRNPRINQEIVRTELKRGCMSFVAKQFDADANDDVVFDGMGSRDETISAEAITRTETTTKTTTRPSPFETVEVSTTSITETPATVDTVVAIPAIDIEKATEDAPLIQFLEQAFEWQQISYVFYPYFWGELPEKWFSAQRYYDEADPLFAKFLQSGAARVLVAVRPGFEEAVMHYLSTRQVWNGGRAPLIDDPLYLSIHEEIRDQQDDLNKAKPYGDPWDVVVPTSLVWLQGSRQLPSFPQSLEEAPDADSNLPSSEDEDEDEGQDAVGAEVVVEVNVSTPQVSSRGDSRTAAAQPRRRRSPDPAARE
jgi:hypothetical protein